MNWSKARKIYIAGPYGGNVRANVFIAWCAGRELVKKGFIPIIPHTMYNNMHDILTPDDWYDITIEVLGLCDAIYMLTEWEKSKGARAELRYAQEIMKIPVFYQDGGLDDKVNLFEVEKAPG